MRHVQKGYLEVYSTSELIFLQKQYNFPLSEMFNMFFEIFLRFEGKTFKYKYSLK